MKKILLATDFSPRALGAMEWAVNFLKPSESEVLLLHVVEPRIDMIDPLVVGSNLLQIELDSCKERMKQFETEVQNYAEKVKALKLTFNSKVTSGLVTDVIKEEAAEMDADAIIMGTHGSTYHFLEKMIGTIANGVANNAPCPVILVPANYTFKPIDNILFASNVGASDLDKLKVAAELIQPHSTIIRCLHVCKDEEEQHSEELANFSKNMVDHSPSIQSLFYTEVGEDVEKIITEYAETFDAEFIVMPKSKKSFFKKIFGHSATQTITYRLNVPLMVIN